MINPGKPFNIYDVIEIFLRRIWFFLIPFFLLLAGTGFYLAIAPKEYKATALMLLTPPKIPERVIPSTVTLRPEESIPSIGSEIIPRSILERVIAEFYLYPGGSKGPRSDEMLEQMRKDVLVESKGKNREGYFTLAYVGRNPQTAADVTNRLSALLIEENLKSREQQAQGTSEFLTMELNAVRAKLEEQEQKLTRFKKEHMGELPEQREANLRLLDQLEMQHQRIGDALKSAQDRKLLLQKQLGDLELMIRAVATGGDPEEALATSGTSLAIRPNIYEIQLEQMRNQLAELTGKYTDKHPDISMTRRKIADLEKKIAGQKKGEALDPQGPPAALQAIRKPGPGAKKTAVNFNLNPRYKEIENQIIATDMEMKRIREEEVKVKAQIQLYRGRIENTPIHEQALSLLTRDYQNLHETYQALMQKSQGARQAENMERLQKGEQFKVIDPAQVPVSPFKPNIPKTILIGLVLGIVFGAAGAFLREQMDRSFRDAEDLQMALGFRVLANIPRIETKAT